MTSIQPFQRVIRLFALPLLLVALVTGCAEADGADENNGASNSGTATEAATTMPVQQRSVRVETITVETTTFADIIELTGEVEALNDAQLSAQTAGTVVSLLPLGRRVSKGATVAQLDPDLVNAALKQAEAQVMAAKAQFDLAQDTYNRQEPLYRDSIISALEFASVRTQLAQAEAQLAVAEAGLAQVEEQSANTKVVAPFSGIIEEHLVDEGEQVNPGVPVARVVSTARVKVRAGVPERFAGDIRTGTPVQVGLRTNEETMRQGRVGFVGSVVNPMNRTFPIEIDLVNEDGRLKPQMVLQLKVTRATMEDVLTIPQTAIIRDENGTSVFVVTQTPDGLPNAERRAITLGPAYGGRVVVTQGLQSGDQLITAGQTNVTEGDGVEIVG